MLRLGRSPVHACARELLNNELSQKLKNKRHEIVNENNEPCAYAKPKQDGVSVITFDPTVTFGAGTVAGALAMKIIDNWLAKSRDAESRSIKDFNELADPLFAKLSKEQENPGGCFVTSMELEAFSRRLPARIRASFNRSVKRYHKAKSKNCGTDDYGGPIHDTTSIVAAVNELIKFTNRK